MTVKDKLLKVIPNFMSNEGYLQVDNTIPLHSAGNILEYTGQLLACIPNTHESELIIGGIARNEVVEGLVPRTIYNGTDEPSESKPDRWEKSPYSTKEYSEMFSAPICKVSYNWFRTDVSHSQFSYLAMGLWACKDNNIAKGLLTRMLTRLFNNSCCIKTIQGNDADEGQFYPLGNCGLRMLAMYNIGRKLSISVTMSRLTRFLLKANLQFMCSPPSVVKKAFGKKMDYWNTYQNLKLLTMIDNSYAKYLEVWFDKNSKSLPILKTEKLDFTNNIEDAIIYLNV